MWLGFLPVTPLDIPFFRGKYTATDYIPGKLNPMELITPSCDLLRSLESFYTFMYRICDSLFEFFLILHDRDILDHYRHRL